MAGASNVQKTPLQRSLIEVATARIKNATEQFGKALPCSVIAVSGAIVTVKFEVNAGVQTLPPVTMPLFGPEYIRYPIQVGDKGFSVPADVFLGQMSGLGTGVADFSQRGNLSTLVFLPMGNKHWAPVDKDKVVIYGPTGVVIRTANSSVTITATEDKVTIEGNLHVTGAVIAGFGTDDQVGLQTHRHTQPSDSHGDSEAETNPPVAGT